MTTSGTAERVKLNNHSARGRGGLHSSSRDHRDTGEMGAFRNFKALVKICLKIQRRVFYISLFKTGERRCSFPTEQEGAVLPPSTIQGLHYYICNCMHILIFFFKHSNTFRNEDVWTMKTLKENLRD